MRLLERGRSGNDSQQRNHARGNSSAKAHSPGSSLGTSAARRDSLLPSFYPTGCADGWIVNGKAGALDLAHA
jgi:hypothetical protein